MAIYKKGTCKSMASVSNQAYVCSKCGYTEVIKRLEDKEKICPKCQNKMTVLSSEKI